MTATPQLLASRPETLTEWVDYFDAFYKNPNRSAQPGKQRPLEEFTDRLAEIGGYITSSKHQGSDVFQRYYAKYFAWLCGLAAQGHLDIEEAMWLKFPGRCPYCGLAVCAYVYDPSLRVHSNADKFELLDTARKALGTNPTLARRSLTAWFQHFMGIYPINLHRSLGDVVERFHEEQSELIRAVREAKSKRDRKTGALVPSEERERVLEELSDLMAWFLTLGARVLLARRASNLDAAAEYVTRDKDGRVLIQFDDYILSVSRHGCRNCRQRPCTCGPREQANRADLAGEGSVSVTEDVAAVDETVKWLLEAKEIDLSTVRVVGQFVVGSERAHFELHRTVNDLREITKELKRPFPILLCGAPGAGKSFFVRELARNFDMGEIVKRDLSDATNLPRDLQQFFATVVIEKQPKIIFLDEVDTAVQQEHACRFLLKAMVGDSVKVTPHIEKPLPACLWFMAASAGTTAAAFRSHLESVEKGRDFLRRFSEKGKIVELSGVVTPTDRVMQALATATAMRPALTHVEAVVLYYWASRDWPDAGALKGSVENALRECNGSLLTRSAIADEKDFVEFAGHAAFRLLSDRSIRVRS